ncbi:MAG: hypothetical protein AB8G18_11770, partial [Gammaproteobacteria bacterium]
ALQLKHWKRGPTTFRELRRMDVPCDVARRIASHAGRWWHSSRYSLNLAMPPKFFDRLGIPRLS